MNTTNSSHNIQQCSFVFKISGKQCCNKAQDSKFELGRCTLHSLSKKTKWASYKASNK